MFHNNKLFSIMFSFMAVMLLVSGCGNKSTTTTSKEKAAPSSEEERIVKHAQGETTIKGTPKRIVTLYQGANDTLVAFGVKPVGIVESWDQKPIYDYL
ncbi:hypothetical protein KPL50_26710, partial [Clostridium sp. CF012]|nr:hypothetical protein [Clostridium sp. CF012]